MPLPLAIGPWSTTELHSALGLKVRTKALSPPQADAVVDSFERQLAPGLLMLPLDPQDFRNADACLRGWDTALRAADALHLAIASGRGATFPLNSLTHHGPGGGTRTVSRTGLC